MCIRDSAYTDKVTGVYEKASPTKDSPTSVTISGKEYSVEDVYKRQLNITSYNYDIVIIY